MSATTMGLVGLSTSVRCPLWRHQR